MSMQVLGDARFIMSPIATALLAFVTVIAGEDRLHATT